MHRSQGNREFSSLGELAPWLRLNDHRHRVADLRPGITLAGLSGTLASDVSSFAILYGISVEKLRASSDLITNSINLARPRLRPARCKGSKVARGAAPVGRSGLA